MPLMVQGVGAVPGAADGAEPPARRLGGRPARLDIGLVNNMPDAALPATERQFARLLAAASGPTEVRLHLFSLDGVPRAAATRAAMAGRYCDMAALERTRLDGLIVTGTEPVAPSLAEEPYWDAMARLVDWAEHNTASTIWSCLAAHAAVLHLDGIARRRLPQKRFGLFECAVVAPDGLFEGAPASLRVPHSRWNDLDEGDLRRHGYRILSRSPGAGVDAFAKSWTSRFVFLQGHPEYDIDTLFREFRRDMRRFVDGEAETCPELPVSYFDVATEGWLSRFREQALRDRAAAARTAFPDAWAANPALLRAWRATSRGLFGNWLAGIAEAPRG